MPYLVIFFTLTLYPISFEFAVPTRCAFLAFPFPVHYYNSEQLRLRCRILLV
jgi:hypothetical protein